MSSKTFISLLLIPLFLGKLFIVDAGVINMVFKDTISIVKPYCKKKQSKSDTKGTHEFEHVDLKNSVTEFSSFCTPQFNFNVFTLSVNNSEFVNVEDVLFISKLTYLYLDSQSPPPKLG